MKDYEFAGKVVLVTGGTGGLGIEVSHVFLKANALLGITYNSDNSLQRLYARFGDLSKNVFSIKKDLTKENDVNSLISDVVK